MYLRDDEKNVIYYIGKYMAKSGHILKGYLKRLSLSKMSEFLKLLLSFSMNQWQARFIEKF